MIYVAARATEEYKALFVALRESGVPISSSWIDAPGVIGDPAGPEFMRELWEYRIPSEIQASSILVLFAQPDDFPFKGALIEVSIALYTAGIPVYIVAPQVTVDPKTYRPFGSWINHPRVKFASSLRAAQRDAVRSYRIHLSAVGVTDAV